MCCLFFDFSKAGTGDVSESAWYGHGECVKVNGPGKLPARCVYICYISFFSISHGCTISGIPAY